MRVLPTVCHVGRELLITSGGTTVLAIILMMTLGVLLAGAVAVYVAYPHRGEQIPVVPQLGDAMRKGVDALPTLEDSESRV
jgi:hypothetical protein